MPISQAQEWIIFDMEWNQPVCAEKTVRSPVYLVGEIIEIGAIRLQKTADGYRIAGEPFKTVICPKYYRKMHSRVAKITGITSDMLENAPSFPEAYAAFRAWCGEGNYSFFTWGPDDLPMLKTNMELHGISTEGLPDCYNLQILFNRQITGESRQWALTDAAQHLGIEQTLTAHDALHDAVYTARIAEKLDLDRGVAEYSGFDGILHRVSLRGFRCVKAIFRCKEIRTVECPFCKKEGEIPDTLWVYQTPGKKIAAYRCACGKEYFLRCRFNRTGAGLYSVGRSLSVLTEEQERLLEKFRRREEKHRAQKEAELLSDTARETTESVPPEE